MSLDAEWMSIAVLELCGNENVYHAVLRVYGEECRSSTYEWSVQLASYHKS